MTSFEVKEVYMVNDAGDRFYGVYSNEAAAKKFVDMYNSVRDRKVFITVRKAVVFEEQSNKIAYLIDPEFENPLMV